jgi:hypothetical protein
VNRIPLVCKLSKKHTSRVEGFRLAVSYIVPIAGLAYVSPYFYLHSPRVLGIKGLWIYDVG